MNLNVTKELMLGTQLMQRVHLRNLVWLVLLASCGICGIVNEPKLCSASDLQVELRLAADPAQDVDIIQKASTTENREIYKQGEIVAKWVPVHPRLASDLAENEHLVTRRRDDRQVELLVLIRENDITEDDIVRIAPGEDALGQTAIDVWLDSAATNRLLGLTRHLSRGEDRRYLAGVVMGQVYAASEVVAPVYERFQIPGDFSDAMIERIAGAAREVPKGTKSGANPPAE